MIPYTRVTIAAPNRRAEIVLPSDEAVGTQYPALLSLLGTSTGTDLPPLRLVRPNGVVIDLEQDLASQQVPDGEILRLVTDDEIPPPAEISDLAGALTEATDNHPWRWKESDRLLGTGALLLLTGAILAKALIKHPLEGLHPWLWPLPGLLTISIGALLSRSSTQLRLRHLAQGSGLLLQSLGTGLLIPVLYTLFTSTTPPAGSAVAVLAALGAASLFSIGARREAWLWGALTAAGFLGLAPLLQSVTHNHAVTAGILGTTSLVLLGWLPWLSLLLSGTSRLDDEALAGQVPARRRVDPAILRSHDALASTTLACAVALGWAAKHLAQQDNNWGRALAIVLLVAAVLRSRAYPLRLEVLALWGSAVPACLALVRVVPGAVPQGLALLTAATLLAAASLYRPAPQSQVRLRRLGNRLESLLAVCTLPLLCGLAGMFTRLLRLFT
ncbi:type VII secretion integral membrane protein EccD [Actinomyces bovis]|uniref:Type VII secretion integral membrane protein EccD n=1 Tax=Actinomyces bovis TaxID=1658 RepID=A0ABY1VTH5_9ACTO|nr:EsaB/YukD family protein [Actinomyces bovis]SPT54328.1 type VII secretion integral membrane protein EccD [Actinomyces bovis]VEG56287.1 type VII secretion integral membrane protein EccD [Actinomyces israelii]